MVKRIINNLKWSKTRVEKTFSQSDLQKIEDAVKEAEKGHRTEIKVVIEGALPFRCIFFGTTSRDRAAYIFKSEKVGITQGRTGVLIYVLMADKKVEILSDHAVIVSSGTLTEWTSLFTTIAGKVSDKNKLECSSIIDAIVSVVDSVGEYSKKHFADSDDPDSMNELSDRPKII